MAVIWDSNSLSQMAFNNNICSKVYYKGNLVLPDGPNNKNYFYILPITDGTLSYILKPNQEVMTWTKPTLYYSLNNGSSWYELAFNGSVNLSAGSRVYLKQDDKLCFTGTIIKDNVTHHPSTGLHFTGQYIVGGPLISLFNNKKPVNGYCLRQFLAEESTLLYNYCQFPKWDLEDIYDGMFRNCTSLKNAIVPIIEFTNNGYRWQCQDMYYGCTSLIEIPTLTFTDSYLDDMSYRGLYRGCSSLKFSETQTAECPTPYTITVTQATITYQFQYMFMNTSGTFTGTPQANTTYYTNANVV